MKGRKNAGLGGFKLEVPAEDNSYRISDEGGELKLRAFLFRDGTLYKDGAAIRTIDPNDIDYETKQKVGKGASAEVYHVLHKPTGEPIALKEISITTKTHRNEVEAELSVLAASIDHPHVVRHIGAFWTPETHRISVAMEWMAYSLADLAKVFGNIDAHTTQLIAKQLVAGVQFLHDEKKVIHRDIKPSNILVNSAGQVKLGDFGISKIIQTIRMSTFVGTQIFMAPERLEVSAYGFVSDVWSLGLTLICCATGKQPWEDASEDEEEDDDGAGKDASPNVMLFRMMNRMQSGALPRFPECFPPEAHDFAARCLERDPDQRATCAELSKHPWIADVSIAQSQAELADMLAHVAQLTRRAAGGLGTAVA
jgi:serine/threonine protein kinase